MDIQKHFAFNDTKYTLKETTKRTHGEDYRMSEDKQEERNYKNNVAIMLRSQPTFQMRLENRFS